jgi:5-methyltetrahydropteroyltriglutamate--homocysteine methyltransferase
MHARTALSAKQYGMNQIKTPATGAILQTTVVGSYPQPDWLVDKSVLRSQLVPRVRTERLWRVPTEVRAEAIQDATLLAIRAMEAAGIDVITDGETARESYSNHFIAALDGIDGEKPATIISRAGNATLVPRVVGPIRHKRAAEADSARFLRAQTGRRAKMTLPGPFTLSQLAKDEHYHDPAAMAFDFAIALNEEARALQAAGIDVIQLDEPWLRNDPDGARRYGLRIINRALQGLTIRTAVHVCFGYAFLRRGQKSSAYDFLAELSDSLADEISIEAAQPRLDLGVLVDLSGKTVALGVLDHSTAEVEPVEVVAQRIRAALAYLPPDRLMPAPDCGMKYMTREVAFGRLSSLSEAAARVRRELS